MKVRPSEEVFHDFASAGSGLLRSAVDFDEVRIEPPSALRAKPRRSLITGLKVLGSGAPPMVRFPP